MIVYFLRHGNAGQQIRNPLRDDKRPLDSEGIEQCRYMGRLLSAMDTHVDLIVSSPLKRATQSAALVGNEIGSESDLKLDPAMEPTATFEQFQAMLRACNKLEAIMVVGHNPSISRFLSLLVTRGGNDKLTPMKKGSIARVDVSAKRAELDWLITPKIARALFQSLPRETQDAANAEPSEAEKTLLKPAISKSRKAVVKAGDKRAAKHRQ